MSLRNESEHAPRVLAREVRCKCRSGPYGAAYVDRCWMACRNCVGVRVAKARSGGGGSRRAGRVAPIRRHGDRNRRIGSFDRTGSAKQKLVAHYLMSGARRWASSRRPLAMTREIMNAIFSALPGGCARLLPKDLRPVTAVCLRFRRQGPFETLNHYLVMLTARGSGVRAFSSGGGDRQPVGQDGRGRRAQRL